MWQMQTWQLIVLEAFAQSFGKSHITKAKYNSRNVCAQGMWCVLQTQEKEPLWRILWVSEPRKPTDRSLSEEGEGGRSKARGRLCQSWEMWTCTKHAKGGRKGIRQEVRSASNCKESLPCWVIWMISCGEMNNHWEVYCQSITWSDLEFRNSGQGYDNGEERGHTKM